jgi:hypothetical protein
MEENLRLRRIRQKKLRGPVVEIGYLKLSQLSRNISFLTLIIKTDPADSKGFRRWCITLGIAGLLDFVHCPVRYYKEH